MLLCVFIDPEAAKAKLNATNRGRQPRFTHLLDLLYYLRSFRRHSRSRGRPLKPIRWTHHALRNLEDREIERAAADRTLEHPEFVVKGQPPRQMFMRQYLDSVLDQAMLLRVVVEETETECVVVTLYKTSQIEKYLKGLTK